MTPKVTALILIPLTALAILGATYSHWQQNLYIMGTVTTGKWGLTIGSNKVVKPVGYDENRPIIDKILPGNQTLQLICRNISNCWHIWVGMIIRNEGILPATLKEPIIQIIGATGFEQNFTITALFYGPYNDGEFVVVWGGVKLDDIPFTPYYGPCMALQPEQIAVTWTEFKFSYTNTEFIIDPVNICINIQYDLII